MLAASNGKTLPLAREAVAGELSRKTPWESCGLTGRMERQRFERDFREALQCGLGPAKLSGALAKILHQIMGQRDLGASWQQISDSLSAVLEADGRPRVSPATLRGIVRRLDARRPTSVPAVSAAKAPRTRRSAGIEFRKPPTSPDLPADAAADLAARLQALKRLS